jgi:hypothetical protein
MPAMTLGGQFLHEDLFAMAAAYLFHITQNHPFVDGNKRTAMVASLLFLRLNGLDIPRTRASAVLRRSWWPLPKEKSRRLRRQRPCWRTSFGATRPREGNRQAGASKANIVKGDRIAFAHRPIRSTARVHRQVVNI